MAICDEKELGREGSWAGAGMLVPGSEFDKPGPGLALAKESLDLYPEFVTALEEESGKQIDFTRCGALEIADSPADFYELEQRARAQATLGISFELIKPGDLPRFLRPGLSGAIYYSGDAQVDPRSLMRALETALSRRRVEQIKNNGAIQIDVSGARPVVRLRSGDQRESDHVVLAAGAWTTSIRCVGRNLPAIPAAFPVKGHLVGYHLPSRSLPHILRFRHTYVVQRSSGYTVAGATVEYEGFNRSVELGKARQLAKQAYELAPGLLPAEPCDVWMGFRPGVDAGGPQIGRWGDSNLWLAYGHFRNGILLAPVTALRMAEMIVRADA